MYLGFYVGMVEAVFPPDHALNTSKYQYEYRVIISGDSMATIPVKCIKMDAFGNLNDFDDATMLIGTRVYVQFPRGDMSMGVIMGGVRQFSLPTDPANKHHWMRRFNEIVQTADKQGAYTVKSIDGPYVKIEKKKITISNAQVTPGTDTLTDAEAPESIIFDAAAKTLTINAREMNIIVNSKDKGNLNISTTGNVAVKAKKNVTVDCTDATVTATGNATVEGKKVKLGKGASEAVMKGDSFKKYFSTHTHPTAVGPSGPPTEPFDPGILSKKVATE